VEKHLLAMCKNYTYRLLIVIIFKALALNIESFYYEQDYII